MVGLPELKDRVRVWPMPGRMVQDGPRPPNDGGRWLPKKGAIVIWSSFHHEQLMHGEILLHAPPCEKHAHDEDGKGECQNCGRSVDDAQKYDVHCAKGIDARKADVEANALGFTDHAARVAKKKAAEQAALAALETHADASPAQHTPEALAVEKSPVALVDGKGTLTEAPPPVADLPTK